MFSNSSLSASDHALYHLSAAIERGDKEDARLWLSRIAGKHNREVIEQGRFSPQARSL